MWPIPPSASPWPWGSCWAPAAPPWWPTRWGLDIWRRPGGTSAFWPWWRCASAWRSAWRGPCSPGRWPGCWGPAICCWTIRSPICGCSSALHPWPCSSSSLRASLSLPGAWAWGWRLRRASPTPCWTISIWGLCRWAYWALPWALLRATRFPPWRGCSFSCSAGRGSALAAPTGICACWAGPASTARPRW